jgi:SAM-dependent methyltransferase
MKRYIAIGERMHDEIVGALPDGWEFDGRRVLDFGCGAGRLLRQFLSEAEVAEFYGSDTDREMIEWARKHLCPPVTAVDVNDYAPPLRYPDSHFDLVMATSVFTHITDQWGAWLLEMHRVLKPDGLMIATFLGRGTTMRLVGEPWDEGRIGMNSLRFSGRAPFVLHSEWWLRAHWGRVFEFLHLQPDGFATGGRKNVGHGYAVLRPKPSAPATLYEVERDEPGEERYVEARRNHLRQLLAEGQRGRPMHGRESQAPGGSQGGGKDRPRRLRRRLPRLRRG